MEEQKNSNEAPKPVYLLELELENILCFKERQKVDLSDGNGKPARWTVILGDNGAGKTTLLRVLASFELNKTWPTHSTYTKLELEPNRWFIQELPDPQIGKDTEASLLYFSNEPGPQKDAGIFLRSWPGFDIPFLGYRPYQLEFEEEVLLQTWFAYGADRKFSTTRISEGFEKQGYGNTKGIFSPKLIQNPEEWLLKTFFNQKSAKGGETRKYFKTKYEKVRSVLINLLPEVDKIEVKEPTIDDETPGVRFLYHDNWVPFHRLGLGYQTLIAWMVDLAHKLFERYPDSENPLAEPCVVFVDEIDLHLHPKWQRALQDHLLNLFPQAQFIVTAHSPLVVQSARDANIVLLKWEGDQVKIYNHQEKQVIDQWRIDQILTSDLFGLPSAKPNDYDELIKERENILTKEKLSEADEKRLEEIGEKLDELAPEGFSEQDMKTWNLLRRVAKKMENGNHDQN